MNLIHTYIYGHDFLGRLSGMLGHVVTGGILPLSVACSAWFSWLGICHMNSNTGPTIGVSEHLKMGRLPLVFFFLKINLGEGKSGLILSFATKLLRLYLTDNELSREWSPVFYLPAAINFFLLLVRPLVEWVFFASWVSIHLRAGLIFLKRRDSWWVFC